VAAVGADAVFVFYLLFRLDDAAGSSTSDARGDVPEIDTLLDVSVEAPTGDIGQIERG